jgi:hypothetical protein
MTHCLHPTLETSILRWFQERPTPAVFLIGPPGVGKTTLAYRVMRALGLRVSEFNASHTRSGTCFRKVILPLLQRGGVIHMMEEGKQGGLGVILDEIDGLSSGEKGGLQTLLTYLREWKRDTPGVPVIFISNTIQQRMLQMISRYCLTLHVGAAEELQVQALLGTEVPAAWKRGAGDLRPLLRGEYTRFGSAPVFEEDESEPIPDGVVPLAHWCLYGQLDPYLVLDLENNDSNLAGLVLVENLPDRLEGLDPQEGWQVYRKLFRWIQESDYADYWAFFYQTWRLLALSQDVKLNTVNLFLGSRPYAGTPPPIESMRYTPVLTKQSALFNAWKLLCEIADTRNVPIRSTHAVLAQIVKAEEAAGETMRPVTKKQDRTKKLDSMSLIGAWKSAAPTAAVVAFPAHDTV